MRLGWDEIKRRAKAFSDEWADAHYEKGETQSFYNDFFEIFGVKRRQVATYEQRVKLLNNKHGFMDLFWPKTLLIEQKSAKLDLNKAGVHKWWLAVGPSLEGYRPIDPTVYATHSCSR
ncbi:MAG: type IIL restriction-modification enzyme MmeI [Sphingorhabdus sp.]